MENDTICKKCCSSGTVVFVLYFIGSVWVICVSFVSSAFSVSFLLSTRLLITRIDMHNPTSCISGIDVLDGVVVSVWELFFQVWCAIIMQKIFIFKVVLLLIKQVCQAENPQQLHQDAWQRAGESN